MEYQTPLLTTLLTTLPTTLLACLSLGVGLAFSADAPAAVTVFNDTFESSDTDTSTKLDDGIEAGELNWYYSLDAATLGVVDDNFAGGGSERALALTGPEIFRRFGAGFDSTALGANVGDRIVLTFDTRVSDFSGDTNTAGFRFGLHNTNGTDIISDSPNGKSQPEEEDDDFGYFVRLALNTTGVPDLMREPAGNNPVGGDDTVDGTTRITTSGSTTAGLTDLLKHTIAFEIERTATGIGLDLYLDGNLIASGTDNSPLTTTFDKVYFGLGFVESEFLVDNVQLQTVPIPEPASLALLGLGSALMLTGRPRRRA